MKFIIGNWKMNGTLNEKESMFNTLKNIQTTNKIIMCLPFTLLYGDNYGVTIGAQDTSAHPNGAYTGDISAQMIKNTGAEYVLVGHSERRSYHNETNEIVKSKANGLTPIICVGETASEHDASQTMDVVKQMVLESVPDNGEYIIAYEPRWAIGASVTPTEKEITDVHETIYETLKGIGMENTPIIYGGNVNIENVSNIINLPHVDGVLIGRASLKTETFLPIIKSVEQ